MHRRWGIRLSGRWCGRVAYGILLGAWRPELTVLTDVSFPLLLPDVPVAALFEDSPSFFSAGPSILPSLTPMSSFFPASIRLENEDVWANKCK
ncbi:hypothetical protein CRG98_049576 [Punica granatum]|uniref:Uncharacterized protein n=1 Tax=Punica granatum TaxID=22663 RepID=A0A2I0HED1_PUNGR|nr:hypothetical protein CRG98_049576 [Punica granatum]